MMFDGLFFFWSFGFGGGFVILGRWKCTGTGGESSL